MPAQTGAAPSAPSAGVSASGSGTVSAVPAPAPAAPGVAPSQDAQALAAQGAQRPNSDGSIGARPNEVYSEDWWSHTRPILEIHGYFRTRAELFHNFSLGRHGDFAGSAQNLWPNPLDNSYQDVSGPKNVALCGTPSSNGQLAACQDKSQASANLRFRMTPELHISDNLRIVTQIDALDNLVLGSTPDSSAVQPASGSPTGRTAVAANGYQSAGVNGYAPISAFATTQGPPTAGINSYRNSIDVKRVWAEYMTPVGQLRFGRMPGHWGLGMVQNSGDSFDSDYQTTTDRIMFVSGIKSIDLYFGGAWEFLSTGPTNANAYSVYGGQPTNTSNLSNVGQWSVFVAHRMNPDLQRLALAKGDVVINGGIYATYRSQLLDVTTGQSPMTPDPSNTTNNGLERRGAQMLIPDPWVQILWKKFRFEAEMASVWGQIDQTQYSTLTASAVQIRQFGLATQTEFKAVEDKLRLQFGFGWASGDAWATSLNPGNNFTQELNGGRGPISTFSFHPDYRVDLIFFRHILGRVDGAYYFRPSVEYDFLKNPNGQKFGGGATIIWSRASEFIQTPGHKRDLGVELDLRLYYQAKDGTLNDDPEKTGGFFAMLEYGVFFPLGGLSYLPAQGTATATSVPGGLDTSAAQTVRLFLGVAY